MTLLAKSSPALFELVETWALEDHDDWPASNKAEHLNQSQGEMRRWWGANDGAGSFSKYG